MLTLQIEVEYQLFPPQESVLDYARAGRELEEAAGNVIKANAPEGKEADWVIEGTLTEIKASAVILGEGAYLTPVLGGWKGDFVVCHEPLTDFAIECFQLTMLFSV